MDEQDRRALAKRRFRVIGAGRKGNQRGDRVLAVQTDPQRQRHAFGKADQRQMRIAQAPLGFAAFEERGGGNLDRHEIRLGDSGRPAERQIKHGPDIAARSRQQHDQTGRLAGGQSLERGAFDP